MRPDSPSVGVDSARLVLVDPLYLSIDAQFEVLDLVEEGEAVVIYTRADGSFPVVWTDAGVLIVDRRGVMEPLSAEAGAESIRFWLGDDA